MAASFAPNNVKRTADSVDGFVEYDIALKRVGADNVVIVRVPCPPNESGRSVLGTGNGLEFYLKKAVLNCAIVFQEQRKGSAAGLFEHPQF